MADVIIIEKKDIDSINQKLDELIKNQSSYRQEKLPEYISIKKAAEVLNFSKRKIYSLIYTEALPATKIKGNWLIKRSDIDALFIKKE